MAKQYRSSVMASIHETAEGLHAAGVMDKQTMRKFDSACLTPVRTLAPEEIRSLRRHQGSCQPMGARGKASAGTIAQTARPCRKARAQHGRIGSTPT